jgi:hypothetical protein
MARQVNRNKAAMFQPGCSAPAAAVLIEAIEAVATCRCHMIFTASSCGNSLVEQHLDYVS